MIVGYRKLLISLGYLAAAPLMVWQTGSTEGVSAIMASLAIGVGTFMWGNSREHSAGNGGK